MDDKTDPGQPAEVPYKWADAYKKTVQTGNGLSGQKHTESDAHAVEARNRRKNDGKAQGDDEKTKAEDFVDKHVVRGVFASPSRTRLSVSDGGRKYYGRDDSLHRARKSWAEKAYKLANDKPLPDE